VASTDAAAVFATLRFTSLRRRLGRVLEAESGTNDPMAIALTLGLIAWLEEPGSGLVELATLVVRQLGLGLLVGVALGLAAMWAFSRIPPVIGAFAPVASVAAGALSFGAADVIGGSGFLAVYLVGLAVGSTPSRHRRQLVAFHEGVAFLAQVVLFVVLGLLVFPSRLPEVALAGLGVAAVLVFVARPAAVALSVVGRGFGRNEQLLLGWAGLRGAVPIVLGTFVLSENLDSAETMFGAVFFVVVSARLQTTTLEWVALRLDVVSQARPRLQPPLEVSPAGELELIEFRVESDHAIADASVRELGLPRTALNAVTPRRADPPRGSTAVRAGDLLYVLTPCGTRPDVEDVFGRWRRRV
jgi:cell volume regulation protein A